ncbi:NAD(P)H azoreductase [Paraliobacillus sp. PM-2]|uniref:SDR family oxidoreductase n=1 Tax=Paraliobacillus sp. PM-2 TaxID=1462524 RepID=UPI00061BD57D|nr:SDR family oxidoreductase [Paraliobacillus sp. PM-2]CQR47311.1 NAD(P)H azoreductase [Paraliobacillus sp. PM-2]
MKVLVTGASGNVGQYVTKALIEKGDQVVVAGTNLQKLAGMFNDKVDFALLDFTNIDTFNNALKNVDRVFLMRPPHLGKPEDMYPFIDAMKDHDIQLVSFLSLMGIESNPIPPHYKIEKYIEASGIPFAHVRPGFFMQNLSGIHSVEIKNKNEVFVPAGNSKTSFIDAKDIGLAIATILNNPKTHKNTAHTITGGQALNYHQIATILSKITERQIVYNKPGFLKYRKHYIKNRGLPKAYVNVTIALYFMTRIGTARKVTDDFVTLTGKKTRTFEEFAIEHLHCFK